MKIKRFMLLLMLGSLLTFSTANAAQPTGRLFTTPAERANLDRLRQTSKLPSQEQLFDDEEEITAAPVLPGSVSMQGYVKRGDGKKGTVWVNNEPVQENSDTGEVRVGKLPREGGQVPINIPASGRSVKLKAGQVYMPETDSVSEDKARATEKEAPAVDDSSELEIEESPERASKEKTLPAEIKKILDEIVRR
jgi:hypothetical protein